MSKSINVIMLGPEAVGKTTLLATMYKQMGRIGTMASFNLTATEKTTNYLDDTYLKVSDVLKSESFSPVKSLMTGTQGLVKHEFHVSFNQKQEFEFIFFDIAGGLVRAQGAEQDVKQFKAQLAKSYIIVNVVDGAALMNSLNKGRELLSDSINRPTLVRDLLVPILKDGQPRIILFVITKCEKWFNDPNLQATFEEHYREVLMLIQRHENLAGMLIPVKTLGCVEFSRFEGHGDDEKMVFVRKPNLKFESEDVDQPLRHALSFALSHHHENRNLFSKMLHSITGKHNSFQESLKQFIQECKAYPTYFGKK